MKITYGVSDLIDWNAAFNAGRARICVHFTGGAITKYGITPAEFTTDDPTVQHIIESSADFKSGRITKLRSINSNPNKSK